MIAARRGEGRETLAMDFKAITSSSEVLYSLSSA